MADDRNNMNSYFDFDDGKKEVIIKRYDTPTPWMNYFSNGTFHTMMSQAGGGLTFYKSPQIWRINRYRFYHLPTDRSGMYMYLRDKQTGKYWSPTAQPVEEKPEKWNAAHGMGYTRFEAEKDNLSAVLRYFVGPFENSLIWNLKLKNTGSEEKKFDIFSFVEYGMMEYMREISWVCYMKHQMSVYYKENMNALIFKYGVETQPKPDETPLVYLAADYPLKGYDGDRDEFIGTYRSESNPWVLDNGDCTNSSLFGGDPCGALQMEVSLAPGEEKTINVFLGTGLTEDDIEKSLKASRKSNFVEDSFSELSKNWENYLENFKCTLPDKDAEREINTWNPYQAQRNFLFSRNISYYATGTFRGVGFRDTSQDVLSQTPIVLEESKDKLRQLLQEQYKDGHVNHYFFPHEGWEPVTSIHSDDHLWPILGVWNVVAEEGNHDFLTEEINYYDGGKATVYEHLKKAVEFTMSNIGERGLPLMLKSDWNDQMFKVCREGKGESFWTSMLIGVSLPKLIELANILGKDEDAEWYNEILTKQKELVNDIGWDGEWYRRAIMDSGLYLGTKENPEAKLWLNAQSWAVMSGYASRERGIQAMDVVKEKLDSKLGIKLIDPSITTFPDPKDPLTNYNKGTGENAAVFCHANTWAIIAECMLGRGDIAWKYYQQLIPKVAMETAGPWRYKAEPYVYVSNLFGPESDKFGLANVSWLSGTAAWMYVVATQYILGVRPTLDGLLIDPCLPSDWENISVERKFRETRYKINIQKQKGKNKGVVDVIVDGDKMEGNVISKTNPGGQVKVNVKM
jgi:cellobiose phosphorylase